MKEFQFRYSSLDINDITFILKCAEYNVKLHIIPNLYYESIEKCAISIIKTSNINLSNTTNILIILLRECNYISDDIIYELIKKDSIKLLYEFRNKIKKVDKDNEILKTEFCSNKMKKFISHYFIKDEHSTPGMYVTPYITNECPICFNKYDNNMCLFKDCGHSLCTECSSKLKKCYCCRKSSFDLDEYIDEYIDDESEDLLSEGSYEHPIYF